GALVVPSIRHDRIVVGVSNQGSNLWSVQSEKRCERRFGCYVTEKAMGVSVKQWYVPCERNAESSVALLFGRRIVAVQHVHIQLGLFAQSTKQFTVVLNWM